MALQDGALVVADLRIRQLDEVTANQIAAGEVVERPSSVVKELVENAIDAKARRITVEVEEGGTRLIRVTDDGIGMRPEDARLSLQRHATSKIRSVDDLASVRTMGFRGEALPSIASVSRFTMTTRTSSCDEATRLEVEGGTIAAQSAAGGALGTGIEVADLFFNVPARKKFLKRPATELGHINDAVTRLAIAHPKVAFRLKHGPKVLIDAPPTTEEDPKGRLARLLGRKTADALHAIPSGSSQPVQVTGYAAEPTMNERTTRGQYVFVNGRFVRDRTIQHAIQDGYRTLMEKGRYPVVILHLEVDPTTYDVNVHPQKTEVRFAQTGEIHRAVTGALRRTLLDQPWLHSGRYAVAMARAQPGAALVRDADDKGLSAFVGLKPVPVPSRPTIPSAQGPGYPSAASPSSGPSRASPPTDGLKREGPASSPSSAFVDGSADPSLPSGTSRSAVGRAGPSGAWPRPVGSSEPSGATGGAGQSVEAARSGFASKGLAALAAGETSSGPLFEEQGGGGRFSHLEPVGQILGTYLVCQGPQEMVVIDQHAAHERIAFQRMRSQRQASAVAAQPLLMPIPLELDPTRAGTAERFAERLSDLGFEITPFGGPTWLVKSTPAALVGAHVEQLILDVLDELSTVEQTTPLDDQVDALLSCAACHSVVRAGDRLSNEEIRSLLVQMDEIDFGAHCPHGRPVFVQWSSADLARLFHRT